MFIYFFVLHLWCVLISVVITPPDRGFDVFRAQVERKISCNVGIRSGIGDLIGTFGLSIPHGTD